MKVEVTSIGVSDEVKNKLFQKQDPSSKGNFFAELHDIDFLDEKGRAI